MEPDVILTGAEVLDADGERIGGVIAASSDYIVVEHGFFLPTDFYIPRSAIDRLEDGAIHLSITKQDAMTAGWSVSRTAADPETV